MTGELAGRIRHANDNIERVYIIGVRLWRHNPIDVYALVLYYEPARGDRNRPLTIDGRIAFFRKAEDANTVLLKGDAAFRKYAPISAEVAHIYDAPAVIDLIRSGTNDPKGKVVTFINELLDFMEASGYKMSDFDEQLLHRAADHLTFNTEFGAALDGPGGGREDLLKAVCGGVGSVLLRSCLY